MMNDDFSKNVISPTQDYKMSMDYLKILLNKNINLDESKRELFNYSSSSS